MIRWLTPRLVAVMHGELLGEFGGAEGLRDGGLLESALARPRNREAYEEADVFRLAAAYGLGICRNHPFVDGNKRVALMAIYTFMGLNGVHLDVAEEEAVHTILLLAEGKLSEQDLAAWLKANSRPRP